jgi:preprotein translocase subunit SecA
MDKDITKLVEEINKLEKKLVVLRDEEKSDKINEYQRELAKNETELENLK